MKARYQYRFYPTDQQKQSLAQLFGCVRVVWNDALALCKQSEKKPKSAELQKLIITQGKQTEKRAWLSEVSAIPLQQSIADLETAFKNFFESCKGQRKGRSSGYPNFKKRANSQSARLTRGGFSIKGDGVYLAKIGVVNPVWSRKLPSVPSSVTVIKDCANRYFLSFVVEINPDLVEAKNHSIGIDLGIKTFAVMSDGTSAQSPIYKQLDRRIRSLQRKLARQLKDSKRRNKTRLQIAKLHNQIADTRKDFLHKLSSKIVNENQVIVLEDLNVSGMVKNRKLALSISQQGWYEFRVLCEAKSEQLGREFRVISRWEPTSQVCADCGFKWGKLDLSIRSLLCLNCGTQQDRDLNAARNIEKVGIGHCHDSKRAQRGRKTTSVADPCEASRITALLGR
ncbi:MAG: transposase [Microcoleus sp. PH2017_29_MFU_D_A]|uniref:RNA-guided endonuclease InsQ/TnpB family protein n=1 Tax=unclassified Microcoleus TaxID=2642155 RepID=UPI001DB4C58F|nr:MULTISPECIES: transposase [unclassified Microcoleus]MCC3416900.1 transposase [Microcoleus sp. PH2017_07_MST_O_A]MCC3430089.1 transposase [Microcoleus sp. PH2017_04_SCI_O_A]MCC3441589.1 transposase [Microcoleus sp. PH2017_03_ELD_O_A]MCC3465057.1 transposase [Microcoleus sp. PH2017_06_SFM_O_A]MCC3505413.1 transposase [Microcoleus sp. PH2017_19_SFW_U_A]MCC3509318.1 transposase [Microcoleus sp. PH2017_17_BER_D_A]TAE13089.1 MAG: transposase [Oscillatoriales cyanobacterium]